VRIVADEKIPYVKNYFSNYGEVILKPGRELKRADLLDADLLIVRSVTNVNQELLEGTPVKFVGSVVTGSDHIDTHWLDKMGIRWAAAVGSNAQAVVEYVISVIAALQEMEILPNKKLRAGVIGAGRIGAEVIKMLQFLNFDVIQNDPIRAQNEKDFISTPLTEFHDLDLISVHTPLTDEGPFPTKHLIKRDFFQHMKKNCVLINAARGAVTDFSDIKEYGESLYWCFDVWENEPCIDFQVLEESVIATPHIAGHSVQAKQRGIDMIYRFAQEQKIISSHESPRIEYPVREIDFQNQTVSWRDVILRIYDPRKTTEQMKAEIIENENVETFDRLRNNFNERHEFGFVNIKSARISEEDKILLKHLGVQRGLQPRFL
jgi:erythronate-4-phosphate dehydrogenase